MTSYTEISLGVINIYAQLHVRMNQKFSLNFQYRVSVSRICIVQGQQ